MHRRALLGTFSGVGVLATAGCSGVGGKERLSDPTVATRSTGRKTLIFISENKEVGKFGVAGSVNSDRVRALDGNLASRGNCSRPDITHSLDAGSRAGIARRSRARFPSRGRQLASSSTDSVHIRPETWDDGGNLGSGRAGGRDDQYDRTRRHAPLGKSDESRYRDDDWTVRRRSLRNRLYPYRRPRTGIPCTR